MTVKLGLLNSMGNYVALQTGELRIHDFSGLGLFLTNSYNEYQSYFIKTKAQVSQGTFQGTIYFSEIKNTAYQTFADFAEFLAYQPYTLEYVTDSGTWYRDCCLKEMTKTLAGIDNRLNEPITLEFINNWYNNKSAEYSSYDADPQLANYGKIYGGALGAYIYHPYYVYIESKRNTAEKSLSLNNNSKYFGLQDGSPCLITITGPCTNPHWSVMQKGQLIATDGFTLVLADNQKLIVSSYPEDQYARVYNPDGSYSDVSQLQDFTKTNFVQIPKGESTILFYIDPTADVSMTFKEERLLV